MKRCQHKNGELIEIMEATHCREFENGVPAQAVGYNDVGPIRGYQFHCYDCKKYIKDRGQKWLKNYKYSL